LQFVAVVALVVVVIWPTHAGNSTYTHSHTRIAAGHTMRLLLAIFRTHFSNSKAFLALRFSVFCLAVPFFLLFRQVWCACAFVLLLNNNLYTALNQEKRN